MFKNKCRYSKRKYQIHFRKKPHRQGYRKVNQSKQIGGDTQKRIDEKRKERKTEKKEKG